MTVKLPKADENNNSKGIVLEGQKTRNSRVSGRTVNQGDI